MSNCSIRPARPGEEAELAELLALTFEQEPGFLFTYPNFAQHRDWFVARDTTSFCSRIAGNEVACAVNEMDGQDRIVGWVTWALPKDGQTQHGIEGPEGFVRLGEVKFRCSSP